MKKFKHILLTVVALATLTLSCVEPLEITPDGRNRFPEGALVFSPKILGITPGTKISGEDSRGENTIRRIDVFVFKTTGGTSTFHKHYTIVPPTGQTELATGNDYLLEADWRNATPAYTASDTYNIYAIANIAANKLRDPVFPQNPTEAELRSLTSESDAQIPGEHGYTCYDIIRLKNPNGSSPAAQSLDHHIGDKVFLMDGKIIGWKITDESQTQQYFINNPVTGQEKVFEFARAAAKFQVELDFSSDFKASLGTDIDGTGLKFRQVTETYESGRPKSARIITIGSLQPDDNNVINAGCAVTGGARAKFANILKATYDWDPTTAGGPSAETLTAFRNAHRWDSQNFYEFSYRTPNPNGGYKYPYIDTTYSYAFSWDAGKAAEYAPALAVSVRYTTYTQKYNDDENSSFDGPAVVDPKNPEGVTNYYRIPLVDITKTGSEAITSVDRNTYYQVTAYINTYGTSTTEIVPTDVNLNYKVIPWPYMPDEVTQAQTTQLQYFVAETEYRLRGDDDQWVYLQYFTPKSNPIAGTTYNYATPKIKNVRVYYYNQDNQEKVLATALTGANDGAYIWDGSSTDAHVTIEVQPSTTDNGGGNIYVNSTALSNRSIKYITFDAEVDFSYDGGQKVTRSFVVTHFPLDNLQSIKSKWSSYWNGGTKTAQIRTGETSYTLPSNWGNNYETGTETTYLSYSDYINYSGSGTKSNNGDNINLSNQLIATIFGVSNNNQRDANAYATDHISLETAVEYQGKYYWVTRSWNGWRQRYDYTYYVADSFYVDCTVYYRTASGLVPSTGNWIDWDASYNGNGSFTKGNQIVDNYYHSSSSNPQRHFNAKFFGDYYRLESYMYLYQNGGNTLQRQNLTNNHIYIVQISRAGIDSYGNNVVLGKPILDNNHQSDDNTVSPAFMIASQLGSTVYSTNSTYSDDEASIAANHCADYMEVAENGYRFTGWRLPTQAEVAYIVTYQKNLSSTDVFDEILSGHYYFTLNRIANGDRKAEAIPLSEYQDTDINVVYCRCIRDLSPEEVIELNATGEITAKSYWFNN